MKSFRTSITRRHRFRSRPTQVGRACKCIVRYIHDQGLQTGDRLPPQEQLRQRMGFSNDTLLAAMGMLVARGGLKRQSGRGTEICDLEALFNINWTVGIAGLVVPDSGPGSFYGSILQRLLSRLSRANCRCNTYFRGEHAHQPSLFSDFPGLEGDIEEETLDGLIVLTMVDKAQCLSIEQRGIPMCHVGFWASMPHAIVVDRCAMVGDAADLFAARGARRMGLVDWNPDGLLGEVRARALADGGPGRALLAACEGVRIEDSGESLVRPLCGRPPAQRPDALIFTEDYSAQRVVEALAAQSAYRPLLAVSTTRQLPLTFALPVIPFELDQNELADRAIAKFRKRLLNPALNGGVEYVKPRFVMGKDTLAEENAMQNTGKRAGERTMKKIAAALMAGLVMLAVSPAFGTERNFVVNNGNLSNSASWNPAGVPGVGDTGIIGDGGTSITGTFTGNLSGPPTALIVRTNGTIAMSSLSAATHMTAEHNIIMEGGTLTSLGVRTYGSSISLRTDSFFMTAGANITVTGRLQNAGADAGRLIVTNASPTLAGSVTLSRLNNTYSGGTLVYAGLLRLSASNTLGTGDAQLLPGSVMEYAANISLQNRMVILGGKMKVLSNLTLYCTNSAKGDFEVESTALASLGGLIEDYSGTEAGRFVKTGTGQLTLKSGTNTYSGGTLVKEGVLYVTVVDKALGKGNVTVTNGAELSLYSVAETTWPGWEVEILSNAVLRLRSTTTVYSTNVVVRNGGILEGVNGSPASYNSYDRVRIEGRVYLRRYPSQVGNNNWAGIMRDGAVPGRLVYTGTGTGRTEIASAQLYTGGTEVEDGGIEAYPLKLTGSGRLPDVGQILVHTNSVLDYSALAANASDLVGGLAGAGLVRLGSTVVTNLEGMSPGTNLTTFGTLSVTGTTGKIVLAASSTNLFHLRGPGEQDKVLIQNSSASGGLTLTAGSTIKVDKLNYIASGTYTLFDLTGGSLAGSIPTLILPQYYSGSIATNSGDVVLTLNAPLQGTVIMVR